ncbi:MAG: isochorismate synthase [Chloroflexi bacterium]|nr:MAG: isochorismate synthase [Chloroflexota bacterium]
MSLTISRDGHRQRNAPASSVPAAIVVDQAALLRLLRSGYQQAEQSGYPLIVSYSQSLPVLKGNLLAAHAVAQELGQQTIFYWERPSEGFTLVGLGEAAICAAPTPEEIADQWRTLVQRALVYPQPATAMNDLLARQPAGPLGFGGFAFDSGREEQSRLWSGFPNGLLILPEILVGATAEAHAFFTINVLVEPGASGKDIDQCEETATEKLGQVEWLLSRLCDALARPELGGDPQRVHVRDLQSRSSWRRMILAATEAIRDGAYRKVVLARSVLAQAPEPFQIAQALADLRGRFADAYVFALTRGGHTFLGASPEQLAGSDGEQVKTMALAGSAPRGIAPEQDARLGDELLQQEKTHNEHAIVVAMIREALAPLTTELHSPETPQLFKLQNVQHLLTPITGKLVKDTSILKVVAALHPTPAVAGEPRAATLAAIHMLESLDRGWYAGPIGWVGGDGSGEFAVALRSALISGRQATLFAGCGIVAGSDPDAEYLESCWKLQVMLKSLGRED